MFSHFSPAPQGPQPVIPGPNEGAAAAAAEDARRKEELEKLRKQNQRTYEITTITADIK